MSSVFNRSDALRAIILKRVTEVEAHGPSANLEQALTRWFSNLYTQTHSDYINQLRAQVLANNKTRTFTLLFAFINGSFIRRGQM